MWVIAPYQSVSLFSLKSALATSSGGKSLLVPTPFAVKMALLDVDYRTNGAQAVSDHWAILRDLVVAIELPEQVIVTNMFTKALKPRRDAALEGTAHAGPFQKTIAFREYVWPVGPWRLALGCPRDEDAAWLQSLLLQVNYLGKRGGFIQLTGLPEETDALGAAFTGLNPGEAQGSFILDGVLQVLDDCGPNMTLEEASVYSGKRINLGQQRILHHVVLPYRLAQSSRSYTLYIRMA